MNWLNWVSSLLLAAAAILVHYPEHNSYCMYEYEKMKREGKKKASETLTAPPFLPCLAASAMSVPLSFETKEKKRRGERMNQSK